MASPMKLLLAVLAGLLLIALIFAAIATGIPDWSKTRSRDYGIWQFCDITTSPLPNGDKTCFNWKLSESNNPPNLKDCEGSLTAARAFSVLSIIFLGLSLLLAIALLVKPALIGKMTLMALLCLLLLTFIWTCCGFAMYLGVFARGHCEFRDYGPDRNLGSSWFLQLFAFILTFFALLVGLLAFMKWKKTPRFAGQPPYVPGPQPGPMPYGGANSMYPQYKSPYPYGPVPYSGGAPTAASYPGGFGTTPAASPYQPTPYW